MLRSWLAVENLKTLKSQNPKTLKADKHVGVRGLAAQVNAGAVRKAVHGVLKTQMDAF
jgi:hypothetical protein